MKISKLKLDAFDVILKYIEYRENDELNDKQKERLLGGLMTQQKQIRREIKREKEETEKTATKYFDIWIEGQIVRGNVPSERLSLAISQVIEEYNYHFENKDEVDLRIVGG